jgi:hypothetical protein
MDYREIISKSVAKTLSEIDGNNGMKNTYKDSKLTNKRIKKLMKLLKRDNRPVYDEIMNILLSLQLNILFDVYVELG